MKVISFEAKATGRKGYFAGFSRDYFISCETKQFADKFLNDEWAKTLRELEKRGETKYYEFHIEDLED